MQVETWFKWQLMRSLGSFLVPPITRPKMLWGIHFNGSDERTFTGLLAAHAVARAEAAAFAAGGLEAMVGGRAWKQQQRAQLKGAPEAGAEEGSDSFVSPIKVP
jgi:hypothetical protein